MGVATMDSKNTLFVMLVGHATQSKHAEASFLLSSTDSVPRLVA